MNHSFLNGQHVVVFGAGYVGGEVAIAAAQQGAQVTALTRNGQQAERLRTHGCEVVVSYLGSADWHDQVARCDHALVAVGAAGPGLAGYQTSYRDGIRSVLDWSTLVETAGHLVYTGTTSVYPQDGGAVVDESAETQGGSPQTDLLLAAEQLVAAWPRGATILRLAGIYGPGRHHILNRLLDRNADSVAGKPETHLNLIHRDDVVSAVLSVWSAGEKSFGRVYNLADNHPPTRQELVSWLCQRLDRPVPAFSGQPAVGRRRNSPDRIISNRRIREELNWSPQYPNFTSAYAEILQSIGLS